MTPLIEGLGRIAGSAFQFAPITGRDLLVDFLILWAVMGQTMLHVLVVIPGFVRGIYRTVRPLADSPPYVPNDDFAGEHSGGSATDLPMAPGPELTVSFIVPVYNDGATARTTIESILAQSVPPREIIVVDDGSTDGTAEILDAFRDRGVRVVHLPANGGKSRAIEAGLQLATSDLVAFTDADSIVHVDYVKEIVRSFDDPRIVAAGGSVESIPHTWITATRQVEYMLTIHLDRRAQSEIDTIFVLPGVSTTYKRDVLLRLGFEHDTIGEDLDLTFRLHKLGYRSVMNLRAKVYTSDPPTLRAYARQLRRWYTDIWICAKKHRDVLGHRAFGAVELPLAMANATIASFLFLAIPLWALLFDRSKLLDFLLWGTLLDVALVGIAGYVSKRNDVWWALLSRYPTRVIARFTFLWAGIRVLAGRPGMEWDKLDRRSTEAFFADLGAAANVAK